jgi:hypothetical protein
MNRGIITSEPVIFVGYPSNQQDFLVRCPGRGPAKLVAYKNLVFGTWCHRSCHSPVELIDKAKLANTEIPVSGAPAALTLQEVNDATDLQLLVCLRQNHFILKKLQPFSKTKTWV